MHFSAYNLVSSLILISPTDFWNPQPLLQLPKKSSLTGAMFPQSISFAVILHQLSASSRPFYETWFSHAGTAMSLLVACMIKPGVHLVRGRSISLTPGPTWPRCRYFDTQKNPKHAAAEQQVLTQRPGPRQILLAEPNQRGSTYSCWNQAGVSAEV
jgi:hypothetical protein